LACSPSIAVTCSNFGFFGLESRRLIYRIERNMIGSEIAANPGAWEAASMFAAKQGPLLAQDLECSGATEQQLMEFRSSQG